MSIQFEIKQFTVQELIDQLMKIEDKHFKVTLDGVFIASEVEVNHDKGEVDIF